MNSAGWRYGIMAALVFAAVCVCNGHTPEDRELLRVLGRGALTRKDDLYEFQYNSFINSEGVIEDKGIYQFVRTVYAMKPKKLWVDWKKPGLKGWTNKEGIITAALPSKSSDAEELESVLWYGAAPVSMMSRYIEIKDNHEVKAGRYEKLISRARLGLGPKPEDVAHEEKFEPIYVNIIFVSSVIGERAYTYQLDWSFEQNVIGDIIPEESLLKDMKASIVGSKNWSEQLAMKKPPIFSARLMHFSG